MLCCYHGRKIQLEKLDVILILQEYKCLTKDRQVMSSQGICSACIFLEGAWSQYNFHHEERAPVQYECVCCVSKKRATTCLWRMQNFLTFLFFGHTCSISMERKGRVEMRVRAVCLLNFSQILTNPWDQSCLSRVSVYVSYLSIDRPSSAFLFSLPHLKHREKFEFFHFVWHP